MSGIDLAILSLLRKLSFKELKQIQTPADIFKILGKKPWRQGILYQVFSTRGIARGFIRDGYKFWDEDTIWRKWYYTARYPLYRKLRQLIKQLDRSGGYTSSSCVWISELELALVVDNDMSHWIPSGIDFYHLELTNPSSLTSIPLKWTEAKLTLSSGLPILLTSSDPSARAIAQLFYNYRNP